MEALKIKLHKILTETGSETSMEEFLNRVHQSSRKYRVVRYRKLRARVTVYDASYLLLADRTKTSLITADKKLYEKAKQHFRITHIRDYP
jgi:predicted nucleic acid-binding protein